MLLYHFRSVAIEYLQKEYSEEFSGEVSAHEILVCFAFYCSNEPASVCDILAALVRQALERADHVLPAIKDLYLQLYTRHRLEGTRPSEDELVELLLEVSKHFAFRFCFLDGLDEALDETKHRLLRVLSSLKMHLFIVSRALPHLEATLPTADCFEIVANDNDIELLVAHTIAHNPVFRALLEREGTLKQEMVTSVKHKAHGM
jgi:hypothetical protein